MKSQSKEVCGNLYVPCCPGNVCICWECLYFNCCTNESEGNGLVGSHFDVQLLSLYCLDDLEWIEKCVCAQALFQNFQ